MVEFLNPNGNQELNRDTEKIAIIDFNNGGGFTISADSKYTFLDGILTYTVTLKNTGNTTALNVVFKNHFNEFGGIIPGTVFVNDKLQGVADPTFEKGIIVGDINSGQTSIIVYKFKANKIPTDNNIKAAGIVTFNYIDDSGKINYRFGRSNLDLVVLNIAQIRTEDVICTYSTKNRCAEVDEIVSFKISIKNTGNALANNILLKGRIGKNIDLIEDSISIDCEKSLGIVNGNCLEIPIGVLNNDETTCVKFDLKVNEVPSDNVLKNKFYIHYSYMESPEKSENVKCIEAREVHIPFINANFNGENFKIECNKAFCDRDEEVSYIVRMKNKGSVRATNVLLQNAIPNETELVKESIYINRDLKSKVCFNNSIFIGDINVDQEVVLNYRVKLKSNALIPFIKNQCRLNYNYEIDEVKSINKTIQLQDIFTKVNTASIGRDKCSFVKVADKAYVKVGEIVKYTLRIINTGNVDACNICIKDEVSEGMAFINGSIYVNGAIRENRSITSGISIEKLAPKELAIVEYRAIVREIPSKSNLVNSAVVFYEYFVDCEKLKLKRKACSNPCRISVRDINFEGENIKTIVDKSYVGVGDELTYTTRIINTGNIPAKNVILKGKAPDGTTLLKDSVFVNGELLDVDVIDEGIFLGNITPNVLIEVVYKVCVNRIPVMNTIVNSIELQYVEKMKPIKVYKDRVILKDFEKVFVNAVKVAIHRECSSDYASVGAIVAYKLRVENLGTIDVKDVVVRDTLSPELEFIEESIMLDEKLRYENIINGLQVGAIKSSESKNIEFKAKVLSYPKNGKVLTGSSCTYKYLLDPKGLLEQGSYTSKTDSLNIKKVDVVIEKSCNRSEGVANDIIQYKVIIHNTGEVDVNNFVYSEVLDKELKFIESSFSLNTMKIKSVNIKSGIRIGTLKRGKRIEILFDVLVGNLEHTCMLYSESQGDYSYKLRHNGEVLKGSCKGVISKFRVANDIKKDVTIDGICELIDSVGRIEHVNNIRANIQILNSYIRKSTTEGLGDNLVRNHKLIINCVLSQTIDFDVMVRGTIVQNTAQFSKKFSSFVNLPASYNYRENINIKTKIQDIFFNEIDKRNISTSVLVTFAVNVL